MPSTGCRRRDRWRVVAVLLGQAHMIVGRLLLFVRTLRFLRWKQIYWRLYLRLRPNCQGMNARSPMIGLSRVRLVPPVERGSSWLGDGFCFLNRKVRSSPVDWSASELPKLWRYNLHYFDYLQQPSVAAPDGVAVILDWIEKNPPCAGDGWEPYPASLRIVNWLKFLDRERLDADVESVIVRSLFQQTRHLRRTLEYHLLANHLFKNAVALLFAGVHLKAGPEPAAWFHKGLKMLRAEIAEQVLPDGGHFERSPMYHAGILEDVLDCLNLLQASALESDLTTQLRQTAERMLAFLTDIVHPDGTLPRFNDTAEGIAPSLAQLSRYAGRLSLPLPQSSRSGVCSKPDFGLCVLSKEPWRCIIDCGPIGPDYQPGHAHCDTLSFELTLDGVPVAVNAGTYEYAGLHRNAFRSTRAHNSLQIDRQEQHEIWSTFRVARRGYPRHVSVLDVDRIASFSGQHTGFRRLPGAPVHQRRMQLSAAGLEVEDRVLSRRAHEVTSWLHLHPGVRVQGWSDMQVAFAVADRELLLRLEGGSLSIEDYAFSPEFGLMESASVLVFRTRSTAESSLVYRIGFA
jgi:uncharacterized heparinase superfamily protein